MKTLAIMQPTFLPWLGYFALIQRVDEFILLDNVQFDRRSYQQRNKLKTDIGPKWATIPVSVKGKRSQKIYEVEILFKKKVGDLSVISKMFNLIEKENIIIIMSKTSKIFSNAPRLSQTLIIDNKKYLRFLKY